MSESTINRGFDSESEAESESTIEPELTYEEELQRIFADEQPLGKPKKTRETILVALGTTGAITFLLVLGLAEFAPEPTIPQPPPQVMGRWTTTDPSFIGRALEIRETTIVIELGAEGSPVIGIIRSIETRDDGTGLEVEIDYTTSIGGEQIELHLDGQGGMHLRNPLAVLWTKDPGGTGPPSPS